jgi:hypothetical protein
MVDQIVAPCPIEGVGQVGMARRALAAGVGGTLAGPVAGVRRHFDEVLVTDASGQRLDLGAARIGNELSFVNHPYTHALGAQLYGVPAGTTIHLAETITVSPPPVVPLPCGSIPAAGGMIPGQAVESCDGRYRFTLQTDGNLVLYRLADAFALWSSGTDGRAASQLVMQRDGNLVLYDQDDVPLWQAGTDGHPGASFALQADANGVVYTTNDAPLWETATSQAAQVADPAR